MQPRLQTAALTSLVRVRSPLQVVLSVRGIHFVLREIPWEVCHDGEQCLASFELLWVGQVESAQHSSWEAKWISAPISRALRGELLGPMHHHLQDLVEHRADLRPALQRGRPHFLHTPARTPAW